MARWAFLLIISLFCLGSCSIPMNIGTAQNHDNGSARQNDSKTNADTSESKDKGRVSNVDTVRTKVVITETPKQEVPVNKKEDKKETKKERKELIKATIAIPLNSGYEASRFIEFINGLNLGGQYSEYYGTGKIEIHVVDIGNDNSIQKLKSIKEIKEADILLGGYQTSQVKTLAEIAEEKSIPYFSLWNSSDYIVANNPYFFQIKPSLETYCSCIARYVSKQIKPDLTIILVEGKNSKDASSLDYFTDIYSRDNLNFKIVYGLGSIDWKPLLESYGKVVINIPNWENRQFVSKALKQIIDSKKERTVTVTGMPQWALWDQADFSLFDNVNLLLPFSNYVDHESPASVQFRQTYFEKYGTWPTSESFYGNDIYKIISKISGELMIGEKFEPKSGFCQNCFSAYEFKPILVNNGGELQQLSYYRNQSITIQKFEGGRFVTVR